MRKEALTDLQEDVLGYIERSIREGGSAPSYRDIMSEFGFKSTSSPTHMVKALTRKGYLVKRGRSLDLAPDYAYVGPESRTELRSWVGSVLTDLTSALEAAGYSRPDAMSVTAHYRDRFHRILDI